MDTIFPANSFDRRDLSSRREGFGGLVTKEGFGGL